MSYPKPVTGFQGGDTQECLFLALVTPVLPNIYAHTRGGYGYASNNNLPNSNPAKTACDGVTTLGPELVFGCIQTFTLNTPRNNPPLASQATAPTQPQGKAGTANRTEHQTFDVPSKGPANRMEHAQLYMFRPSGQPRGGLAIRWK